MTLARMTRIKFMTMEEAAVVEKEKLAEDFADSSTDSRKGERRAIPAYYQKIYPPLQLVFSFTKTLHGQMKWKSTLTGSHFFHILFRNKPYWTATRIGAGIVLYTLALKDSHSCETRDISNGSLQSLQDFPA